LRPFFRDHGMKIVTCIFARIVEWFAALGSMAFILPTVAALLTMLAEPVSARVKVEGLSDDMSVSAEAASVREVLAALSARYNLAYEPSPELDRSFGGRYSGTLQQVLRRVLEGYDFIIKSSPDSIELRILWLSRTAARSIPIPDPVAPANQLAMPPQPPLGQGPSNPQTPAQ
jgi:hypothetical protein